MSTDRTQSPSVARDLIIRCMEVKRPVFLWGPPGIGKSELVEGIAKEQGRPVIDMRLLLLEPTDLKGIPFYDPEKGTMRWANPSELPGPTEVHLHNAILFLDELSAAPPAVQAAAYQLVLNRRVGEYELPDGVSIVAAGNRDSDKAVTFRMPSPLANRFTHLTLAVHFPDWLKWAVFNNVDADVVGFLSHHKQMLFTFDPKSPDKAFCTPRSWVNVSDLVDDNAKESDNTHLVAGTVGESAALQFAQHRRISSKLPKPEAVLEGRVKDLKVKEVSAMYSLAISMCYTLKEWLARSSDEDEKDYDNSDWHVNVDFFFEYLMNNFGTEMIVLGAKIALRDYALPIDHRKLKNFKQFHKEYGSYILDD